MKVDRINLTWTLPILFHLLCCKSPFIFDWRILNQILYLMWNNFLQIS